MSTGRLESQITVPSGGWSVSVAITGIAGSPFTVTIPAGTYYPTDLLSTFKTQLDAADGGDGAFTVTGSFGEGGTGFVTIAHATQTITVTWTSTDLRDCLGFTGTLTPAALTFTGTRHAQGVWLPGTPLAAEYGPADPGHTAADRTETISPRGDVWALQFQTRTVLPRVTWSHVLRRKARVAGEVTTGESFERWWRYTHGGELSYFAISPPVRLYWDADVASYHTYRLTERKDTGMPRVVLGWAGVWTVELTNLVRVPGT